MASRGRFTKGGAGGARTAKTAGDLNPIAKFPIQFQGPCMQSAIEFCAALFRQCADRRRRQHPCPAAPRMPLFLNGKCQKAPPMHLAPTIETPRLRLRAHRPDDFDAYAAILADPGFMRFFTGQPMPREVAWARFLRQQGIWPALGFGNFAVELKETGALIGEAGFHDLKRDFEPSIEGTLE